MDKEQTKEAIKVMQAYADGKGIQVKHIGEDTWYNLNCCPSWDWINVDYRIKPEPKVRPYMNGEECLEDMKKHVPFGWLKNKESWEIFQILRLYDTSFDTEIEGHEFPFALKHFTYADGSPFGIVEE